MISWVVSYSMVKIEKLLSKLRNNPLGWQIETLKEIARRFDIEWRQPGTSHVTFRHPNETKLTVPAHRPIKPVYIRKFVRLIDEEKGE